MNYQSFTESKTFIGSLKITFLGFFYNFVVVELSSLREFGSDK